MSATDSVTQQLAPTADVSTAVVMAVADTTETNPENLPTLYNVIDPDALDSMFQSRGPSQEQSGIHVTFTMAGCTVSIRDGAVTVTPDDDTTTERTISPLAQEN